MDIWAWIYDWQEKVHDDGDQTRMELFYNFQRGMDLMHSDPNRAASTLAANAEAARRLNEQWWALLNEHWRLQALLNYSRKPGEALDVAVRAAMEARKCPGLPQRVCIHEDLITSYVGIDALGHAKLIQEALDYMEREVSPTAECRYCLYGLNREFALEKREFVQVAQLGFEELAALESNTRYRDHHGADVLSDMCRVALSIYQGSEDEEEPDEREVRLSQAAHLLAWASAGEEMAERAHRDTLQPALTMWHAVAARILTEQLEQEEDEDIGDHRALYARARALASSLRTIPADSYYAAWRTYHDSFGEWEEVMEANDAVIESIKGCGRKAREARAYTYRCFVLANLGRLTKADIDQARAAVQQLIEPEEMLQSLDSFEMWLEGDSAELN